MSTIAELIQASEERLAREQKAHAQIVGALGSLPQEASGFDLYMVHPQAYKADLTLSFKNHTLEQARAILRVFPACRDMIRFKDSCLSFFPESAQSKRERENERAEVVSVYGVLIECENISGPSVGLVWYSTLENGTTVKVSVELDKPSQYITQWTWDIECDARGREVSRQERFATVWHKRHEGTLETARFSGSSPNTFGRKVLWLYADETQDNESVVFDILKPETGGN